MSKPPTTPPSDADESAREFELRIAELGESRARWDRLLALLEEASCEST